MKKLIIILGVGGMSFSAIFDPALHMSNRPFGILPAYAGLGHFGAHHLVEIP